MVEGERNTIFFHHYASTLKSKNTIWDIVNQEGLRVSSFRDLSKEVESYFSYLFKDLGNWKIGNLLKVVTMFPSFFTQNANEKLQDPIFIDEIKVALAGF